MSPGRLLPVFMWTPLTGSPCLPYRRPRCIGHRCSFWSKECLLAFLYHLYAGEPIWFATHAPLGTFKGPASLFFRHVLSRLPWKFGFHMSIWLCRGIYAIRKTVPGTVRPPHVVRKSGHETVFVGLPHLVRKSWHETVFVGSLFVCDWWICHLIYKHG